MEDLTVDQLMSLTEDERAEYFLVRPPRPGFGVDPRVSADFVARSMAQAIPVIARRDDEARRAS